MVRITSVGRTARSVRIGAVALSMALVVTACGGGGDDEGASGEPGLTNTTEQLGDPVSGGEITVALEAETNSWLPGEGSFASSGRNVAYAIYDPLLARTEEGEIEPFLAESFTHNDDLTEYTLKLREGITFHDGTPLDAQVLKTIFDEYLMAPGSNAAGRLSDVQELRVDDELTVTYVLNGPNAAFPDLLTGEAGWPFSVEAAEAAGDNAGSNPVGTGPFQFESWNRDDRLVVTRNPDYWREGLPYLDRITFKPIPDEDSRVSSLLSGDVDAMTSLRGATIKQAMDADGLNVHTYVGNETGAGILNVLEPPLDDVRIRRAIAQGLNPEDVAAILGDDGLVEPTTQWVSESSPWYSERVAEAWPKYDPEAAAELVAEYTNDPDRSDGKPVGTPPSFNYACPPDATLIELAQLAKEAATASGFDITLEQVEQSVHISNAIGNAETDPPFRGNYMVNCFRVGDQNDPAVTLDGAFGPVEEEPLNFTNFRTPELAQLIEDLKTTAEFEDRYEIMEEIGLIIADQVPVTFAVGTPNMVAGTDEVKNIPGWTLPSGASGEGIPWAVARWGEVWVED